MQFERRSCFGARGWPPRPFEEVWPSAPRFLYLALKFALWVRFVKKRKTIYIRDTHISDKGTSDLGAELGKLINLTDVSLNFEWLSPRNLEEKSCIGARNGTPRPFEEFRTPTPRFYILALNIALWALFLKKRKTIYISCPKISDKGASGLGAGLGKLTNLTNVLLNFA